jgi:hypothetical protein
MLRVYSAFSAGASGPRAGKGVKEMLKQFSAGREKSERLFEIKTKGLFPEQPVV